MTKRELLQIYLNEVRARDEWIDKIPWEIQDSFFDNPFVDSLHTINNILMEQIFSTEQIYDIDLYIENFSISGITADGKSFNISTDEEFIEFVLGSDV